MLELGLELGVSSWEGVVVGNLVFGLVAGALVGLVEEAFEFVGEDAAETT
jgi:hypothetical protein